MVGQAALIRRLPRHLLPMGEGPDHRFPIYLGQLWSMTARSWGLWKAFVEFLKTGGHRPPLQFEICDF
jgi:hypothetical protein